MEEEEIRQHLNEVLRSAQVIRIWQTQLDECDQECDEAWKDFNASHKALWQALLHESRVDE